ncbi:cell division protein ZapA [Motiliproteus sediminis]|uniref:cell division protein ZapA n=1 Tax=Motiliproteus sediminis TaxID=1468178 RepID=UPI001AEF6B26|nr:cell division protein ZapA [Motiliproteus sediminis]
MPSPDNRHVTIKILDKEFVIACPPEARAGLLDAATDLNRRMSEVKSGGKVFGLDRIAVMTALNLSHELQAERAQREQLERAIETLSQRIDAALGPK